MVTNELLNDTLVEVKWGWDPHPYDNMGDGHETHHHATGFDEAGNEFHATLVMIDGENGSKEIIDVEVAREVSEVAREDT